MATTFDFETALKQLQSGQALTGENGILTPLIKQLTEAALEAEIENYIEANPKQGNHSNGYTRKTSMCCTLTTQNFLALFLK